MLGENHGAGSCSLQAPSSYSMEKQDEEVLEQVDSFPRSCVCVCVNLEYYLYISPKYLTARGLQGNFSPVICNLVQSAWGEKNAFTTSGFLKRS